MRWLREFLDRYRRRTLIGGAIAAIAVTAVLVAPAASAPRVDLTAAVASSGTGSCSWTTDSSGDLSINCSPSTTTTTQPPATTTTTVPPTTTTTTTAPPSGGHALIGLYNNGTSASTLGISDLQVDSDYAYGSTDCSYAASGAEAAKGELLMLGVGACTASQDVAIGDELVAGGQPDAVIRLMWEMNQGGWAASWNEKALTATNYKAEWITEVNAFRSIPGTDFKFDYNLDAGTSNNIAGRSNFDSFPGTAYVDYIGIDVYDTFGSVAGAQAAITTDAQYAQSVGLPWTIPEWGMGTTDDPAFVHQIWLDSNLPTCAEEALFSAPFYAANTQGSALTNYPNSLAEYKADFDPL